MESATLLSTLQAALGAQYALERELGRGGMATVYLARDVRHRRAVAVKVLHPELSAVLGPERFLARDRAHRRRCSTRTSCRSSTPATRAGCSTT